jgi:uncharacterized protein (DUF1697 family)
MKCVALLRAVNVGGRIVKMDQVRAIVEAQGFTNVETFIASGNVIFHASAARAARAERTIEAALETAFGYAVPTFVRTTAEVADLAAREPFAADAVAGASTFCVGFLKAAPDAGNVKDLLGRRSADHDFHVHGREVFWLSRLKANDPAFAKIQLERILGTAVTVRGINTVRRLAARYPPETSSPKARA